MPASVMSQRLPYLPRPLGFIANLPFMAELWSEDKPVVCQGGQQKKVTPRQRSSSHPLPASVPTPPPAAHHDCGDQDTGLSSPLSEFSGCNIMVDFLKCFNVTAALLPSENWEITLSFSSTKIIQNFGTRPRQCIKRHRDNFPASPLCPHQLGHELLWEETEPQLPHSCLLWPKQEEVLNTLGLVLGFSSLS